MLEKLLKAKHWQLFVIVVGIPLFFQFFLMTVIFGSIGSSRMPDPTAMFAFMPVVFIVYIAAASILFAWYYAIVVKLDTRLPAHLKINMKRFKLFFYFPLVYIGLMALFVILMITNLAGHVQPSPMFIIPFVILIVPLHLFSIFCIGHTFYCVGKTIKSVELKRAAKFEDFAGEFFLAWFYLVGFWILQPKINRLWERTENNETIDEDDDVLS
ncbi:MAG: hypothetical protein HYZ14_10555 [Bacteroidetes bacterium]|nr:hypothetical protein [Bacteroidota bacterium]